MYNYTKVRPSDVPDNSALKLIVYFVVEIALSVLISLGNGIVLVAYLKVASLRTTTNTYIFSLALTDFLTGLIGIPFTVFSEATGYPQNFYSCILVHIWILILCTVSILHLLGESYYSKTVPTLAFPKYTASPQVTALGAVMWHDFPKYRPMGGTYMDIKNLRGARTSHWRFFPVFAVQREEKLAT